MQYGLQYVWRSSIVGEEELIEEAVGRYLLLLGDGGIEDSPAVGPRGGCGRHCWQARTLCVDMAKYSGPANHSCQGNFVEWPFFF